MMSLHNALLCMRDWGLVLKAGSVMHHTCKISLRQPSQAKPIKPPLSMVIMKGPHALAEAFNLPCLSHSASSPSLDGQAQEE